MTTNMIAFSDVYKMAEERMRVYKIVHEQYPVPELESILKQWQIVSDDSKTNNQVDRALKKIGKQTIHLNVRLTQDVYLVNAFNRAFEELEAEAEKQTKETEEK